MALFYLHHAYSWHNFGFWNTLSKQLRKKETNHKPTFTHSHLLLSLQNVTKYLKVQSHITSVMLVQANSAIWFFPPPLFIPITKRIFTKSCRKRHKFTEVISSSLESGLGSSGTSNPSLQSAGMILNVTSQVYDLHKQLIL